jgi:hypothetical protein
VDAVIASVLNDKLEFIAKSMQNGTMAMLPYGKIIFLEKAKNIKGHIKVRIKNG